ncbi:MAG: shikimate dehydrogenase [Myxococcales bacterium]|nr:shikimate dehydrogenase [Polyangiaceae bacterium]MDW8248213.1 shikimate dehydrogenase [Myxococcales bacterium]
MHRAGYLALNLEGWHYEPFRIVDLPAAVAALRALGLRGVGVSMPFKLNIIPLLDELEPVAAAIGAVNTVVNEEGRLIGYNTDWLGAIRALEEVRPIRGARVLLLGAGGAARAVAYGLRERGATLSILNRNTERAAHLAEVCGASVAPPEHARSRGPYDILINATSVGMYEVDPGPPILPEALHPDLLVMDIVYKPINTALVRAARTVGAAVVHGGRMLLHQAAAQFELYTGRPAPLAAMESALQKAIAPSG